MADDDFGEQWQTSRDAEGKPIIRRVSGRAELRGAGSHEAPTYSVSFETKNVGIALEAAIAKDFGHAHTKIQGVPVSASLIEGLAQKHSSHMFVEHQRNAERLAEANRLGEIGRKDEMKRIFGIEI